MTLDANGVGSVKVRWTPAEVQSIYASALRDLEAEQQAGGDALTAGPAAAGTALEAGREAHGTALEAGGSGGSALETGQQSARAALEAER